MHQWHTGQYMPAHGSQLQAAASSAHTGRARSGYAFGIAAIIFYSRAPILSGRHDQAELGGIL